MPTAILRFLTVDGFVVIADGLSRDRETGKTASSEQKLFLLNEPSRSLIYALTGTGRIHDPTDTYVALDLTKEMEKAVMTLKGKTPENLLTYGKKIAAHLQRALGNAKNAGRIIGYPIMPDPLDTSQSLIATLFFWGYYNDEPARAVVKIRHRDQSFSPLQGEGTMVDPWPDISGSSISALLLRDNPDPRLASFWIPAMAKFSSLPVTIETFSLSDARDIGLHYIHACESDVARRIDPDFAPGIGGKIHIATVTKKDGARWMPSYEPQ